jgi:predicted MFS family arabinose efflux permease
LPDLVTREDLGRAVALNSSAWQGAALFGPTLAGVTVATIGVAGAFYANAASFLAVVAALFLMRGVPELTGRAEKRTLRGDLFDGLSYVSKTNLILTLLLLSAVTNIFGRSYTQLLPAFARDVLDEGSLGLGLLMSAPGAGTLLGAAVIAILSDVRRKGVVFFAAMLVFSAILVVFASNRSFALALGLLFLSGIASLVFSTMLTTMLQLHVTNEMRGRVMSLVTVTMQGFAPFGALLTGALATRIGIAEAVALSAVVVGVAAVVAAARARSVRDFTHDEAGPEPAPAAGATLPAAGSRLAEPRQP